MEKTVETEVQPDSDEGGIQRRLRDRVLLRKRKAEAEEKATNQWVYGSQSPKRVKKKSRATPGRKGRPKKEQPILPEEESNLLQEADVLPITVPVALTLEEAEELQPEPECVETPTEGFLIEDVGPEEEQDQPLNSFIPDAEVKPLFAEVPEQSQILSTEFPEASPLLDTLLIRPASPSISLEELPTLQQEQT